MDTKRVQLDAAAESASRAFERCTCVAIVPPSAQPHVCAAGDLATAVGRAAGITLQLLAVNTAAEASRFLLEVRTKIARLAAAIRCAVCIRGLISVLRKVCGGRQFRLETRAASGQRCHGVANVQALRGAHAAPGAPMFCADTATRQEALLTRLPSVNAYAAAQIVSYAHGKALRLAEALAECADPTRLSAAICPGLQEGPAAAIARDLCSQVPWEAERPSGGAGADGVAPHGEGAQQDAPQRSVLPCVLDDQQIAEDEAVSVDLDADWRGEEDMPLQEQQPSCDLSPQGGDTSLGASALDPGGVVHPPRASRPRALRHMHEQGPRQQPPDAAQGVCRRDDAAAAPQPSLLGSRAAAAQRQWPQGQKHHALAAKPSRAEPQLDAARHTAGARPTARQHADQRAWRQHAADDPFAAAPQALHPAAHAQDLPTGSSSSSEGLQHLLNSAGLSAHAASESSREFQVTPVLSMRRGALQGSAELDELLRGPQV